MEHTRYCLFGDPPLGVIAMLYYHKRITRLIVHVGAVVLRDQSQWKNPGAHRHVYGWEAN